MSQKKQAGVLLLTGAGAAVAVGLAFATPQKPTKAHSAAAADLSAMMRARSPGDRLGAETNKPVKVAMASSNVLSESSRGGAGPSRAAAPRAAPSAGVAATAAPVAVVGPSVASQAPALAPAVLPAATVAAAGIPAVAAASGLPAAAGFAALPLIPAIFSGGGGGGGGSPAAVSAVPEPATWLMMIMGFGILGSALRRRRRYGASGEVGGLAATAPLSGPGVA